MKWLWFGLTILGALTTSIMLLFLATYLLTGFQGTPAESIPGWRVVAGFGIVASAQAIFTYRMFYKWRNIPK